MRPKTCARKLLVHRTDNVVLPLVDEELVQVLLVDTQVMPRGDDDVGTDAS